MTPPVPQAGLRLLKGSSDAGAVFVRIMLIYLGVCAVVLLLFWILMHRGRQTAKRRHSIGMFGATHWPIALRGTLSLTMLLVVVLPSFALVVALVFGSVLAAIEGWSATLGIEYLLSNMLGLQEPLTDVVPEDAFGRLVDICMSIWAMLLVVTAMGLAANMSLMSSLTDIMPTSTSGFIRCILLYIPVTLLMMSVVTGGILALIEGWPFGVGFFFMGGSIAGLANPIVPESPETGLGCFFEIICISLELCLGGAVIGLVGAHPFASQLVSWLEGTEKDPEVPADSGEEAEKTEAPEAHLESGEEAEKAEAPEAHLESGEEAEKAEAPEAPEVTALRSKVASLEAKVRELEAKQGAEFGEAGQIAAV